MFLSFSLYKFILNERKCQKKSLPVDADVGCSAGADDVEGAQNRKGRNIDCRVMWFHLSLHRLNKIYQLFDNY